MTEPWFIIEAHHFRMVATVLFVIKLTFVAIGFGNLGLRLVNYIDVTILVNYYALMLEEKYTRCTYQKVLLFKLPTPEIKL